MARQLTPQEDADLPKPTRDRTARHVLDQRIRSRGYTIYLRPKDGQPIWSKGGIPYSETDVILRESLGD